MFWIGLGIGMIAGVCCLAVFAAGRRMDDRVESCEACPWWQKLEACRADCKALEEQLETTRKSRNALQGVVNQQLYTIKALKREKCIEMGQQFFSNAKNLAR